MLPGICCLYFPNSFLIIITINIIIINIIFIIVLQLLKYLFIYSKLA